MLFGDRDNEEKTELEVEKMKMLRFSLLGTRMKRIRKENFRGVAHVRCSGGKTREASPDYFDQDKTINSY